MCWSATADLRAGIALTGLAVVSLGLVKDKRQVLLALCPLLLGVHQLVESRVWLSLHNGTAQNLWTLAWGVIACPVLAFFAPLAVLIVAPHRWRYLVPLLVAGATIATICSYGFVAHGVTAVQDHHVLDYDVQVPLFIPQMLVYQLCTWGSMVLSGDRYLRQTGVAIAAAGAVAAAVDIAAYESIWCAFGAVVVFLNVRWLRHAGRAEPDGPAVIDLREPTSSRAVIG
jgi:hypothetical protein